MALLSGLWWARELAQKMARQMAKALALLMGYQRESLSGCVLAMAARAWVQPLGYLLACLWVLKTAC
jgi:hypothetical protein